MNGFNINNTTLTIREDGEQISLLVNGVEGSSLGNDRMGRGAVGIVAVGIGEYSFRNFEVGMTGTALDSPTSQSTNPAVANTTLNWPGVVCQ